jgi:aminopeptidase N
MKKTALIVFFFAASSLLAQQRSLRLSLGDPARKDKEAKIVLDAVTATDSGELLNAREVVTRLAETRLIFVGESHTTMDFHRVQLKMIEELQRAGRKVMIGLEMYPSTEQKYLDDWCRDFYSESGFIQMSHWYKNWGYSWNYYREIFLFARDHGVRMFALNAPREVVSAVSKKGLANLSPEEKAHIAPKIDTSSEEHLALFKAFFAESMGMNAMMSDSRIVAMFASQCTWDATMGYNAVQALKEAGDPSAVMVVLIGSGHVAYNLGIQRQAAQWYNGKMASIIPIEVLDDRDRPVASVQASYADYLWGIPPEKAPLYPELGAVTNDVPGETRRGVLSVDEGSPAQIAGFQTGDILISMDGTPLPDGETMNRLMAEKRWGDSAVLVVRRQPKNSAPLEVTLKVDFRRRNPASRPATPGK